jgi:DNA-binding beta-propeller fold protein YncE
MKQWASGRSNVMAAVTAAVACVLAAVSCAPPAERAAGTGQALYVANARDDTISVLDSQSGRPLGPAVPSGRAPGQIGSGPPGTLLHLTVTHERGNAVTWLHRAGHTTGGEDGGWAAQPLQVGASGFDALAASDGAGTAVLAYRLAGGGEPARGSSRCQLAVVDLASGAVQPMLPVCGPGEWISSVALGSGPAGPVAYVGLWHVGMEAGGLGDGAWQRVVAVDVRTGALLATLRLAAPPEHLALAVGPEGFGARLYVVEPTEFAGADFAVPARARLLALDPVTLEIEREYALTAPPVQVAVAPDGAFAYFLTTDGTYVWRVDLRTGAEGPTVTLPGRGTGLVATDDALYVANPLGSEVWALDHRRGRLAVAGSIPVGRHPVALALGPRP